MNSGSDLDIFVVHSPFQLFMAEHIVQTMPEEVTANRWLLIDGWSGTPDWSPELWTKTTLLSPPLGGSVRRNGAARLRMVRTIGKELEACDSARLWLANVQWPLNNLLYRDLRKGVLGNTRHYNFPEGIGSLLCPRPDVRQRARDLLKMTTLWTGGSGYRPFSCDLMGVSVADRVFTLCREFLEGATAGDVMSIPTIPTRDDVRHDDSLIFIGQNYDDHLASGVYRRLVEGAAQYARKLNVARMLYKPHHFASSTTERDILRLYDFELLDWSGPIESYLTIHHPKYVVSYNSSALVHAKLMLGNRTEAIAYGAVEIQRFLRQDGDTWNRMNRLFDMCGVRQVRMSTSDANGQEERDLTDVH